MTDPDNPNGGDTPTEPDFPVVGERLLGLLARVGIEDLGEAPKRPQWWSLLVELERLFFARPSVQQRVVPTILSAVPDLMMVMSPDGIFLDFQLPAEFLGVRAVQAFVGRSLEDYWQANKDKFPRVLVDETLAILGSVAATGQRRSLEFSIEVAGQLEHFEGRYVPYGENVLALIRRTTEDLQTRVALQQRETLYANLFRNSTDGIIIHDELGLILEANRCALEMFGFTRDEMLGHRIAELHAPEAGAAIEDTVAERLLSEDDIRFEAEFLRRDGSFFMGEVSSSAFDFEGRRVVQALIRDITARRQAEASQLHAMESAERANEAQTRFLHNMSHELRTPLNAILGFGRVLTGGAYGELNERQSEYLTDIVHSGEHMLELVNNLLDLRRLEERSDSLDIRPSALHPIIERAAALVRPLLEERRHQLHLEVDPELPGVAADPRSVVRVVVNFLSNAIKYTPSGGCIVVRARARAAHVTVEVQDDGPGIPPEDQARVFNYFERLENGDDVGATGSGIGLALCRELVQRMSGRIGLRSRLGVGSVFYFTLPIVE